MGCKRRETTFPLVKDLTVSIYAPGKLADPDAYLLHAPSSGLLQEWRYREGDSIRMGQVLASIQSKNSDLNQANARLRVEEIETDLRPGSALRQELDLQISLGRILYEDDSTNYERQRQLWAKNIGSKAELEARKLAFEASRKQWLAAIEQQKIRLKQLSSELKSSRNLLTIARNQSLDFQVESRINGILAEILVKAGEWVGPQQPIGRMGGLGDFILELEVDEVDIVRIERGQLVAIALDAYPDQVFSGEVTFINTRKDDLAQSYRIEVRFSEKPKRWYSGMTAEANIVIEEKQNALLVPRAYLVGDDRVVTAAGDTLRVEIGESDLEYSEVLSGLDAETELQKPGA